MSKQMEILQKIESGEITPEEGQRLLAELDLPADQPASPTPQMDILGMIERGEIGPEEGAKLLRGEEAAEEETSQMAEAEATMDDEDSPSDPPLISDEEIERWKRWWQLPLYAGVVVTVLSISWMNSNYLANGYSFWFFCSWLPLALGVLLIGLSWSSKTGPWLHVRVKQDTGRDRQRVAVSMPLPLKTAAWLLRNFGHLVPQLGDMSIDEVIIALGETAKSGNPFYVEVTEENQHVQVFIG